MHPELPIQHFDISDKSSWPFEDNSAESLLVKYWLSKRIDGRAPYRADTDLCDLWKILPNVFLVEQTEESPPEFVFRFVGTAITAMEGEITGARLSSLIPRSEEFSYVWNHYRDFRIGKLGVRSETLNWCDKEYVSYRVLLLPLLDQSGNPNFQLGVAHSKDEVRHGVTSGHGTTRAIRRVGRAVEYPAIEMDGDKIVTADYVGRSLAVSPETVRYTRQKVLELGNGEPLAVIVKAEAARGFDGEIQGVVLEEEHSRAIKAVAILTETKAGRVMAKAYLSSAPAVIPAKHFENYIEATAWLKSLP